MNMCLSPYGPDLAVAEEPGNRHIAQLLMEHTSVVVGLPKKGLPASQASKEQRTCWRSIGSGRAKPVSQVCTRRRTVSHVKSQEHAGL